MSSKYDDALLIQSYSKKTRAIISETIINTFIISIALMEDLFLIQRY